MPPRATRWTKDNDMRFGRRPLMAFPPVSMRRMRAFVGVAVVAALVGSGSAAAATPSAKSVVTQLKAAGMPVKTMRVWTETTDPNSLLGRPGQYVSKVTFHDRRLKRSGEWDVDWGGDVEVFASKADAKRRYDYILPFSKQSLFAQYVYLEGKALLRVSHVLTPAQARAYERAFRRIV